MGVNIDKIKKERLKRGMSYQAFAELIGVSTLTVYYWESGKFNPSYDSVDKLTEATGKTREYYYDLD